MSGRCDVAAGAPPRCWVAVEGGGGDVELRVGVLLGPAAMDRRCDGVRRRGRLLAHGW
jgi:hypothetical protein